MSSAHSYIEELQAEEVAALPDAALEDDLSEVLGAAEVLEGEVLRRLAVIDRRRSFQRDGFLSTVTWLSARFRLSRARAAELVRLARSVRNMPLVQAAFAAGEISRCAVRVLVEASQFSPQAFAESEALLVQAAQSLSIQQLQQAVTHWKQAADLREGPGEQECRERRRLFLSRSLLGMVRIDGDLDAEIGECVLTALQAAVDADVRTGPEGDPRTPAQRRADGLGEICRGWLDHTARPQVGGERPHLNVMVDLKVLKDGGAGRCEFDHTGPIPPALARRLACDASVSRVVLGPRSEPLDLGRRTPVVPPSLRRAVVIRDKSCRFPGCERPHAWCDAHHLVHWADGGPTSIANLILLCRAHHRLIHSKMFRVRTRDGIPTFFRPDGSLLAERAPP